MALFESMFGFDLLEGIVEKNIRQALIDKNPGFFNTQSADSRIANLKKISAEEFVDKIKSTFNIDNVTVHPPNSGPNKKSITSAEKKKLDARKKGATGYTGGRSEGGLMNKKGDK